MSVDADLEEEHLLEDHAETSNPNPRARGRLLLVLGTLAVFAAGAGLAQHFAQPKSSSLNSAPVEEKWLFSCPSLEASNTNLMVDRPPAVGRELGYAQMPIKPTNWSALRGMLTDEFFEGPHSYGYASSELGPMLMYWGTRVPGVFEHVPEKLRGVFWLYGNPVTRELLATFDYSISTTTPADPKQQWMAQFTPFSWAWDGGPLRLPCWYCANHLFQTGEEIASRQASPSNNYSYGIQWETCPADRYCTEGTEGTYLTLQIKGGCDLEANKGGSQLWTMEEIEEEGLPPGSKWHRGVYNLCGQFHLGGYTATKIIDGDGSRIEPHFSDFQAWMDGHPLILWSGYNGR